MSWTPILPEKTVASAVASPVTISIGAAAGRFKPRLTVTVRPEMIPDLTWWKPDTAVKIMLGTGEHAGLVRFEPKGPWKLRRADGKHPGKRVRIAVLAPSGAPAAGLKTVPVEFDYGDDWLEITLPSWARPEQPKPAISGKPQPFSISSRVPDPAIALQAARGGRVR